MRGSKPWALWHEVRVRTPAGKRVASGLPPMRPAVLAHDTANLLRKNLDERDDAWMSAPRCVFTLRDVLAAAGVAPWECTVEIVHHTVTRGRKRSRVLARIPPTPAAAERAA